MTEDICEPQAARDTRGQTSCSAEVICCVHSSDEVSDFFVSNGLGACQDSICSFLGIEDAADLKLIELADLHSSRFSTWANGSLTIVQQKKLMKAFS
jgi:hypothetical protein